MTRADKEELYQIIVEEYMKACEGDIREISPERVEAMAFIAGKIMNRIANIEEG